MKKVFTFLILVTTIKSFSQNTDTLRLSDFKLCELTVDILKQKDATLKSIKVEEMDMCSDGFIQDIRFENRMGYRSILFPGVIFQKYEEASNSISKIHLTNEFKGFLPNGNYIDLSILKAKDILNKYDSLNYWTSRGCSDYWAIKDKNQLYFYVKIDKEKLPRYPVDEKYYSEQLIVGIDLIADCYTYNKTKLNENNPLFILEGKEISKVEIKGLNPNDIESINVLKDQNAINKYGQRAKNGVVEIFLKKKK